MTQGPFDPNTSQNSSPDPNRRRFALDFDEMVALLVAFLALGSVAFWSVTRGGFSLANGATLFGAGDDVASRLGLGRLGDDEALVPLPEAANGVLFGGDAEPDRAVDPNRAGVGEPGAGDRRPIVGGAVPVPSGRVDAPEVPRQAAQPAEAAPTEAAPTAPTTLVPTGDPAAFRDVPDDYWAKPFIDAMSARGLIAGFDDGTFKPDDPVTRAQLARIINEAFPLASEEDAIEFTDISSDYWAASAIQDTVRGGFLNGFPDKTFKPDISVPRVQVLTALVTGLKTEAAGNVQATVDRYSDAAKIPDWATGKMAAATQSGLVVVDSPGSDLLAPNQPATRAEVAAMVYQALLYQGKVEPIESQYIVEP